MREKLTKFIKNKWTQRFILFVIIFNSIILGMMTSNALMAKYGNLMNHLCNICVWIFTVELAIKLYVYKKSFFKDGWNIFDFFIVFYRYHLSRTAQTASNTSSGVLVPHTTVSSLF